MKPVDAAPLVAIPLFTLIVMGCGDSPSTMPSAPGPSMPGSTEIATVQMSPTATSVDIGRTRDFSARAIDRAGRDVSDATFT
jgi:hypothetical protein